MIRWNDGLNIGVQSLDDEHKNLLNIINKLSTVEYANKPLELLELIFDELICALKEHTIHEEALLQESNYIDIKKHTKYHTNLVHNVETLKTNSLALKKSVDIQALNKDLIELLLKHVVIESMPLMKIFKEFQSTKKDKQTSLLKQLTTKTTNILNFTKRLLLSALIPLIGMMILGFIVLWHNYDKYSDMKVTYDISHILQHVNSIVHNLQIERGLSSGHITSKDNKFKENLEKQYIEVDKNIKAFKIKLAAIDKNKLQTINKYINSFKLDIKSLKNLRKNIIRKEITQPNSMKHYSKIITNILNITSKIALFNHSQEVSSSILSLSSILQFKEALGQERAHSVMFIERKNLTPNEYIKFIELISLQKEFLNTFEQTATKSQKQLKDTIVNSTLTKKLNSYRANVKNNNLNKLDSKTIFIDITKYIDYTKELENQLLEEILLLLTKEINQTFTNFILWLIYTISVIMATIFTIYLFEKSSKKQVNQIIDAIKHLAEGGRNLRLISDTMDDKMTQMYDAYETTRQKLLIGDIYMELYQNQKEAELIKQKTKNFLLEKLAYIDPLTDAVNRRKFSELSEHELSRALRYKNNLSFLMLDIDNFKAINDTYGHDAGDSILKHFSSVCIDEIRELDVFARIGGEEFVIMLPETNQDGAYDFAERLRKKVSISKITIDKTIITYSVSIGISVVTQKDKNMKPILKRADEALYEAKENGKNMTIICSSKI